MAAKKKGSGTRPPLKTRTRNGYTEFFDEKTGTWVATHRRVAEKNFGISNTEGKHIHHLDEDKTNNRPSNLVALTPKMHARLHNEPQACFHCGRTSHWVEDCRATTDYLGRPLKPR